MPNQYPPHRDDPYPDPSPDQPRQPTPQPSPTPEAEKPLRGQFTKLVMALEQEDPLTLTVRAQDGPLSPARPGAGNPDFHGLVLTLLHVERNLKVEGTVSDTELGQNRDRLDELADIKIEHMQTDLDGKLGEREGRG